MMGKAHFQNQDFVEAVRTIVAERGPSEVTVDAITSLLSAPRGSFYHRFSSLDLLRGQLWLKTVCDYQQGFIAHLEAGDGLKAALHVPAFSRLHLDDARMLLLYSRHDFVAGEWPDELKFGVRAQAERLEKCMTTFCRRIFGRAGVNHLQRVTYALLEAPVAAVKSHLRKRERPPPLVDRLIGATYKAVVVEDDE
jgi:AcrR family transcriptional regulator